MDNDDLYANFEPWKSGHLQSDGLTFDKQGLCTLYGSHINNSYLQAEIMQRRSLDDEHLSFFAEMFPDGVPITIIIADPHIARELLYDDGFERHDPAKLTVPNGLLVEYCEHQHAPAFTGLPVTIQMVISFAAGVGSGILVNWLYDKLRGSRSVRLYVESEEVEIEETKITQVVEKTMRKKRRKRKRKSD